ncbi:DUF2336 domain-containing protein [Hyphobacterium sp. CCMP332]|uniref:DUF2336 domain-containing protein n=1 Tax=Hyphobacterium sp. CCMP332 TaxID=2749086 RepID=UPI0016509E03|nr:DUF2336 domain-containing protein [Hyphobacterium sp. CCMP332]QNL19035.1 DUF2336 domain-containing protein [Hyphobacterium sp. CCMP332]
MAPRGIVRYLAFDAPSVAKAIIEKSLVLEAEDLVELAETGSEEHRKLIAGRCHIGMAVSDAVARRSEASVIERLIRNTTARISDLTMAICIESALENEDISRLMLSGTISRLFSWND